jgi:hypothetical protein
MITNLIKIDERNNFIANIIHAIGKCSDRKILIISDRLDHLETLKNLVDKKIKLDEENNISEPGEITTSKYIGSMKDYELKYASEANIIFGTYAMVEEGLDIPELNTLIFATPKKKIIQSIGRILRKPDYNIPPLIVDIADQFSIFEKWNSDRKKYYDKNSFNVSQYLSLNDKCLKIGEYLFNKKIIKDKNIDEKLAYDTYIINKYGIQQLNMIKQLNLRCNYNIDTEYNCDINMIFTLK